jgi:hypothetical protein
MYGEHNFTFSLVRKKHEIVSCSLYDVLVQHMLCIQNQIFIYSGVQGNPGVHEHDRYYARIKIVRRTQKISKNQFNLLAP